jgi:hypothetical protein
VFGEWGGKSSSDYQRENVKVRFDDEGKWETVSRQLEICRRIAGNSMA